MIYVNILASASAQQEPTRTVQTELPLPAFQGVPFNGGAGVLYKVPHQNISSENVPLIYQLILPTRPDGTTDW